MKKQLYLLLLSVFMLCFAACKDCYFVESDLHGLWQVTSITNKSTGEVTDPQGTLYYSFQRSMVKLGYKYPNIPEGMVYYVSCFDFVTPDSIGMGEFVFSSVKEDKKVPIENLHKFGLYEDYTIFGFEHNRNSLRFSSDEVLIELRKY